MKFSLVVFCVMVMGFSGLAQEPKGKTIDVTSTFKPVLREASKINFNAAPPVADSSKPRLNYTIPVSNLYFTYRPAELKPVALQIDSLTAWQYSNFIKVGIGNVHLPYAKAGFSFGNNTSTYFNVFATHYNSKGSLTWQKNNYTDVGGAMTYKTPANLELNVLAGFRNEDYFLYGYQPTTLVFTKSDLLQRFQTAYGKVHLRNIEPTTFGLNYHPSISLNAFSNNRDPKANEVNTVIDLPLEKTFGEQFTFKLGVTADLTNYKRKGNAPKVSQTNNVFLVPAALAYKSTNLFIHAGMIPSWDNSAFKLLPNIMADITTNDKRLTLQLGWVGHYDKGSYQRFASINPWLASPDTLANTKVIEFYGGIKGSLGDHFSYTAKVGFQRHANMPLFVNDAGDGKTFLIRYEPQLDVLQLHGEVGYNVGEQFSASAGYTFNRFNLDKEKKAYGVLPVETNVKLRWQLLKDLWLTSQLWAFDGAWHTEKDINGDEITAQGKAGFDFNAGAEFRITKNFNLWVQFNNIFSSKYQRWNQYEVYGFNVLGGITYSFNKK
jgi:hypothetical protein